jgi:Protein of unknown function (DUF4058)
MMPIHDWTRVNAGIFHDFHCSWITAIKHALNHGVLPDNYYALAEQVAGDIGPDVVTLQANGSGSETQENGGTVATAVALVPPRTRFTATTEIDEYAQKQHTLVIHHSSEDRIIALVEILSPGNKSSRHALRSFLDKAVAAMAQGYHLLLLDLLPPGPRDPEGIHGAIWTEIAADSYRQPPDKPLTLVAYAAGHPKTAYIEPVAVGDALPAMPLFLTPRSYVSVPLEATYQAAWEEVPKRWRSVLESPAS